MNLDKYTKQAIVKSIMADIPQPDRNKWAEEIKAAVMNFLCKGLLFFLIDIQPAIKKSAARKFKEALIVGKTGTVIKLMLFFQDSSNILKDFFCSFTSHTVIITTYPPLRINKHKILTVKNRFLFIADFQLINRNVLNCFNRAC